MNLVTQIKLIIFSIFFGIYFSLFSDINYSFLNNENYIRRFFFTTLYSIVNAMIYFLILLKINRGSLHIYSFICIVVSYIMTDFLVNKYKK